jgi:hypothetical protein
MGSTSLTDAFLYNLFPHEGFVPQPVAIGGFTIFPPDDSQPERQRLAYASGVLYYDYQNILGNPCTLVLDAASGWIIDFYQFPVTVHALSEGPNTNLTLVGCSDGTVRNLVSGGVEQAGCLVATGVVNFGDARGFERIGDVFVRANVTPSSPMAFSMWSDLYATALTGYNPTAITGTGLVSTIVDFSSGFAKDANDISMIFTWLATTPNYLDLWQPSWIELPETSQDRPTDWSNGGDDGNKFYQGLLLEVDTLGRSKTFAVQDDQGVLHTPVEVPFSTSGQTIRSFTFNPPFTSHMVRIVTTDNVPWRLFPTGDGIGKWMAQPFPEASTFWGTEAFTYNLNGYIHAYQTNLSYIAADPITCNMTTDQGNFTIIFPPGGTGVNPVKVLVKWPRNKWKVASLSFSSPTPFYLWKNMTEHWIKQWDAQIAYTKINPFGGESSANAEI